MRMNPDALAPVGDWKKPSRSGAAGHCVQVGTTPDGVIAVRNSNHPQDGGTGFTRDEFTVFVDAVKAGEYDQFTG